MVVDEIQKRKRKENGQDDNKLELVFIGHTSENDGKPK